MMTVYLVALAEQDKEVWKRIKAEWPENHHPLSNTLAMVAIPSNGVSAPSSVAQRIGIGDGEDCLGIVLKMDSSNASGWLPTAAVDWFENAIAPVADYFR